MNDTQNQTDRYSHDFDLDDLNLDDLDDDAVEFFQSEDHEIQMMSISILKDEAVRVDLVNLTNEFIESQTNHFWKDLYDECGRDTQQYIERLLEFLNRE